MGKFKDIDIELQEARKLLEEHSDPEDCNCDQALKLTRDLLIAIKFGSAAEHQIEEMGELIEFLLSELVKHDCLNKEKLYKKFNIKCIPLFSDNGTAH